MWTLAVHNSDELIYIWSVYTCLFSIWTTRKMHDFQGYFSWTFQDQSDFPGLSMSWNFQEKKSRTFQEAWEPCRSIRTKTQVNWEIVNFYLSPHEYPLTDHAGYLLHGQLLLAQIWSQLASGIYRQQVREKTRRQDSNVRDACCFVHGRNISALVHTSYPLPALDWLFRSLWMYVSK